MLPGMISRTLRPEDLDPQRIQERGTKYCTNCGEAIAPQTP
jgi:hypothetical protein